MFWLTSGIIKRYLLCIKKMTQILFRKICATYIQCLPLRKRRCLSVHWMCIERRGEALAMKMPPRFWQTFINSNLFVFQEKTFLDTSGRSFSKYPCIPPRQLTECPSTARGFCPWNYFFNIDCSFHTDNEDRKFICFKLL